MFKFFLKLVRGRRSTAADAPSRVSAQRPSRSTVSRAYSRPGFLDRLPVPEVIESDDESAWDEWEHSNMQLDSRLGPLSAYDSIRVKDPSPSQVGELDPFGSVRKKRK